MADSGRLLAAGVLGDGLGSLAHGVLGQLTGQKETDGGLDLPAGDGGPPVVVGQTGGLGGDALEDVVDEGVHDGHGLAGDAGVGVHLLQHLVDVDGVDLPPPLPALLVPSALGLCLGGGLLGSLAGCLLGGHPLWSVAAERMRWQKLPAAIYSLKRAAFVENASSRYLPLSPAPPDPLANFDKSSTLLTLDIFLLQRATVPRLCHLGGWVRWLRKGEG